MENYVIAISREFGSGGRHVGEKLGLELGIPFYSRDIIEQAASKSGLSVDFIEQMEERASNSFLFNLVSATYTSPSLMAQYDIPVSHKAFFAQAAAIQEMAEKSSCVIVGRCADYILRDHPNCIKVLPSWIRAAPTTTSITPAKTGVPSRTTTFPSTPASPASTVPQRSLPRSSGSLATPDFTIHIHRGSTSAPVFFCLFTEN